MLPGILAQMLIRLDRIEKRSRDENDLYHALLEVGMRLRPAIMPSRQALLPEGVSPLATPGPDAAAEFIRNLEGQYTYIDSGPLGLGPGVTRCTYSECPLKQNP